MQVFKFGGASINSAEGIKQVARIITKYSGQQILIVVSAMGKTTNALEKVVDNFARDVTYDDELKVVTSYHSSILLKLFKKDSPIWHKVDEEFRRIYSFDKAPYDQVYDRIVSIGEMVSTLILHQFLIEQGVAIQWIDARKYIATDQTFREGKVDWTTTRQRITNLVPILKNELIITQGFIGGCANETVTLGRDGSDYSAAIFASCMEASAVTIWKDVPGVMNADPRRLPEAVVFDELPFREAAEMTYYGASVIHPKTIKPLANKGIPLHVKNFDNPSLPGTIIHELKINYQLPPLVVFKDNQCLVSCRVTDYTFIDESQLSFIFQALSDLNIKINVMQNSAISFSFCIDYREDKVARLLGKMGSHFEVYYNTGLTLITVKNYDAAIADKYRKMPGIVLEQLSRSTLQVLVKN